MPTPDITVAITSCNRHDLLERTLTSFFANDTGERIARILVAEDGDSDPGAVCRKFGAEYFMTGTRVGQMRLIDQLYAKITTPYIFHLEDDWEFYRPGFIEKSHQILEANPRIIVVQLRPWNRDERLTWIAPDASWAHVDPAPDTAWHGFSLQPALRRLSDFKLLGSFAEQKLTLGVVPLIPAAGLPYEAQASDFYFRRGYFAAILDRPGYVRHTGDERHVLSQGDNVKTAEAPRNAPCPCGSGLKYKHCHGKLA